MEENGLLQPEISQEERLRVAREDSAKALRRQANVQGGALLIYKVIMNVALFAAMFAAAMAAMLDGFLENMAMEPDALIQKIMEPAMDAVGYGYLLAVSAGYLILWLWKRKAFFKEEIYRPGKPMTVAAFFTLVCLFFGIQVPAQLWSMGLEWVSNLFGRSMDAVLQSNAMDMDDFGIWLYVSLAAPITEELLFRGLVLRSVQPWGRKLAVLVSSVLFGLFHGSPVQTPYAILAGLVLGYVAVEYNIVWAMVLHVMNNLLLSDTLPRLLGYLPYNLGETVLWIFLILCAVVAMILLLRNWLRLRQWCGEEIIEPWQRKAFWRAPCIVILCILCSLDIGLYFLLLLMM